MYFTLNGVTKTYDDNFIIAVNLLEEMNALNETLPSNELKITLDNTNGEFNMLNFQNMHEILASRPEIRLEFGLVIPATETIPESIEWVAMGTYFLNEWKNEKSAMTITLYGNDVFDMLSEVSYNNTVSNTLYNLAVDVLTKAGITNYLIDDSLKSLSAAFKERIDSRTALQHIGIASRAAVFQDRTGKVVIKPFTSLDGSSNYLSYAGQAWSVSGTAYPLVTTGAGMKYIDYDNMYEVPDISLEKSVYEVVISIYDGPTPRDVSYINTTINGKNGLSVRIDNPLITSSSLAASVADWIIKETNYNAIYKTNWRQNPILECTDVILVEDSFEAKKQTRIVKQEFIYEGYLMGNTESRGGI
jgi:hypothetical protein